MNIFDLLIIVFATWYTSYAITQTHGPGGVFDWIREHVWHGRRGQKFVVTSRDPITNEMKVDQEIEIPKNGLLDCPVCLAPWVALALLLAPMGVVTQALGVAGLAMIFHGWSGWRFAQ